MRATMVMCCALALAVSTFAPAAGQQAGAQQPSPQLEQVRTHVGHLADAFNGTPGGQGLVPAARAEAEIVVRHATLAASDTSNLDAMKLHAGHVLHAIDPTAVASGPGLGYGVKQAAQGIERHAKMIWDTEGAPRPTRLHAEHITVSARNVVERADSIAALAVRIREATAPAEAADMVRQLRTLSDQVIPGVDANRDGGIGWRRGEGGLEQIRQHLAVLHREAGGA